MDATPLLGEGIIKDSETSATCPLVVLKSDGYKMIKEA